MEGKERSPRTPTSAGLFPSRNGPHGSESFPKKIHNSGNKEGKKKPSRFLRFCMGSACEERGFRGRGFREGTKSGIVGGGSSALALSRWG